MNDSGATYEQVLQSLFGAKSQSNIKKHKNIKNSTPISNKIIDF
jgi:hypothetical protein